MFRAIILEIAELQQQRHRCLIYLIYIRFRFIYPKMQNFIANELFNYEFIACYNVTITVSC